MARIFCVLLCLLLLFPSFVFTALYFYSSGPYNPPVVIYILIYAIPVIISFLVWLGIIKSKRYVMVLAGLLMVPFILAFVFGYFKFIAIQIPLDSLDSFDTICNPFTMFFL